MTTSTLANFFLWCAIVNYAILIIWFAAMLVARDAIYKLHSRWFRLSEERFDGFMYLGMAIYKILVLVLNVAPFIALKIIG